jgi:general secretion pathway protein M
MILSSQITDILPRRQIASSLLFVAIVLACMAVFLLALSDLWDKYLAVSTSSETLGRLQSRSSTGLAAADSSDARHARGSPLLEGQTVTVASAALLRRATAAITGVGGNLLSSEVDPTSPESKDGQVRITVTCELEESALQPLLYDIEAGAAFLFVEQLVVQTSSAANEGGRLRVVLGVSGAWRVSK